jgi:radical SAM protein with 4Fe4S-binding SPASM domain
MCRPENYRTSAKSPFLSKNVIDKLIAETFDSLKDLRIDSAGEHLLSKHYAYVLNEAKKRGISVFISTNGTLLNEKYAELICDTVESMQISLDSPDKETLETLRGGARFEDIINGAKTMVRVRKTHRRKKPHIDFHAALFRPNLEQLPDLVRLAKEIGIDGVTVAYGFVPSQMDPDWAVFWEKDKTNKIIAESWMLARKLNLFFNAPLGFEDNEAKIKPTKYCQYLFEWTYIDPSGHVTPCCIGNYNLGDLNQASFSDIWLGEKYNALRRTYNTGSPVNAKCASCYITTGWNPNIYKSHFSPDHWEYAETRIGNRNTFAQEMASV